MQFNDNAAALPGRINSINNTLEHEAEGRPIGKRNTSVYICTMRCFKYSKQSTNYGFCATCTVLLLSISKYLSKIKFDHICTYVLKQVINKKIIFTEKE